MEESNIKTFVPKEVKKNDSKSTLNSLSPREIVSELDRFVVGQNKAKILIIQ
jgi:ATP-dependent HslUV protease ATP-binding subunit HslU